MPAERDQVDARGPRKIGNDAEIVGDDGERANIPDKPCDRAGRRAVVDDDALAGLDQRRRMFRKAALLAGRDLFTVPESLSNCGLD